MWVFLTGASPVVSLSDASSLSGIPLQLNKPEVRSLLASADAQGNITVGGRRAKNAFESSNVDYDYMGT